LPPSLPQPSSYFLALLAAALRLLIFPLTARRFDCAIPGTDLTFKLMKKIVLPLLFANLFAMENATNGATVFDNTDSRVYELRTYYAAPGKLDDLNARFRNHTCKLFEKHGMVNIGYWVPIENPDNKLIYIVAHESREAARKSWGAFGADPDWKTARDASEKNGKLVNKLESVFLAATDYSPAIKASVGKEPRIFELRTYKASPGNLGRLNARFRNHTLKLFAKHGMKNVGYWTPTKDQKSSEDTLIYILAHQSKEAAAASFKAFGEDPDWVKAKEASEKEAGGSLTVAGPEGVKSLFMKATDYSQTR